MKQNFIWLLFKIWLDSTLLSLHMYKDNATKFVLFRRFTVGQSETDVLDVKPQVL